MNIRELIKSTKGKYFTVKFEKRSTGEVRVMLCRIGVSKYLKGGSLAYDPVDKGLVTVWDRIKKDYRSIPVENVISFKCGEKTWEKGLTS